MASLTGWDAIVTSLTSSVSDWLDVSEASSISFLYFWIKHCVFFLIFYFLFRILYFVRTIHLHQYNVNAKPICLDFHFHSFYYKNKLFNTLTFCEWCILRRTLWTSGLLSKVEVWLDGGCEYSEVFSSSEANGPCILPIVGLDLRNLQPGPIGLLAILYNSMEHVSKCL